MNKELIAAIGIFVLSFGLIYRRLENESFQGSQVIFSTMVITVFISVFAHGFTAFPGANWYANQISNKQGDRHKMPEMKFVEEMPVRLPWRQ